jgi:uncharacterized protein (TIGR03435 family)
VKLNKSAGSPSGIFPGPGTLTATNMTLEGLILWAYNIKENEIVDSPSAARSDHYDIAAKAYGAPDASHLRSLLQALLVDRFKLAAHRETRDLPVYLLKVEPKGSKLTPAVGPTPPEGPQLKSATNLQLSNMTGQHAAIAQLVSALSRFSGRPVINETSLQGSFDFKLEWTPDREELLRSLPASVRAMAQAETVSTTDPLGQSIFTALREQLGLRLEASKRPGEVVVVDHVERTPTEN